MPKNLPEQAVGPMGQVDSLACEAWTGGRWKHSQEADYERKWQQLIQARDVPCLLVRGIRGSGGWGGRRGNMHQYLYCSFSFST